MKKDELVEYVQQLQRQQQTEMVAVNTRLPRALRDDLKAAASSQGVTLQALLQQVLTEWMDGQQD